MHAEPLNIDIQEAIDAGPILPSAKFIQLMIACVVIGIVAFFYGVFSSYPLDILWGSYYTSLLFWMGLAVGGVMTTVIFQIVRAKWSPPVRRIAEANVAFLPWALFFLAATYIGKEYLFPWATAPMPGRESYMQPDWVYCRVLILFAIFFYLLWRYTKLSLRSDLGVARERAKNSELWKGTWYYAQMAKDWKGEAEEVPSLQRRMSVFAPVLIICYALIYTLFSTEMIVGMDTIWFSNMFGGFQFLGNVYMGWATTALIAMFLASRYGDYGKTLQTQQLWDLGMLLLGFCMLWGYTFFSQFLPQWYGNMPEETQWLILRTRELPWKGLGYVTFSCCFVIPFILLLSEDVKKTPKVFWLVCVLILFGVWTERYMIIMPQISPKIIPLSLVDVGIFLGFLGVYGLSLQSFLKRFPFIPVSHPLTRGSSDW